MKVFSIVAVTLLPLSVLATPLQAVRDASLEAITVKGSGAAIMASKKFFCDAAAESVGLAKRSAKCDIKHVDTEVDCWWYPIHKHTGDPSYNRLIGSFKGTTKDIVFDCYARCENVQGITYVLAFYY
jgi:hypothetical protein